MENTNIDSPKTIYGFKSIEEKWIRHWYGEKTYQAKIDKIKPKFYCLDTYPYPSSEGVHIGYVKSFGGMDVIARYMRMRGYSVLYPMAWDTLGLPAENYAIKSGRHPREITDESISNFKKQFQAFGLSYDWDREFNTADPEFYKWTQWLFLIMFKAGLAYRKKAGVNWCPSCKTILANENVEEGKCWRCGTVVIQKKINQWFFKITDYADRLDKDCKKLNWNEMSLKIHKNWIGKKVKDGVTCFHIRDWSVSRQRYWGPPIPIVYCKKCGVIPVPESELPIVLPHDVDYTPTGEAPLAKDKDFVNTKCPKCGMPAKREVETLDTFVSSAWYQFRFVDPKNNDEFASKKALEYWGPIDHYQGTTEHLTAHLIYARFVTKVLFDHGLVPFDEPFPKYTPVGLLVDKTGTKFSKHLHNAPDTNILIDKYGGDLLRLSCQFITPFSDVSRWGESDVVGVGKFRDRVWRIFNEKVDGRGHEMPVGIRRDWKNLISTVGQYIEQMKYNVALSKMMVFINKLITYDGMIDRDMWEGFVKVFAPFAPFITEEMWSGMGHNQSVHLEKWPQVQIDKTRTTINMPIQVNGKTKAFIKVNSGSDENVVKSMALNEAKIKSLVTGEYKLIFVKDKIINFVV